MARLARAVAPGLPHHVTQRGNRRQRTFLHPDDHGLYKALLAEHCRARGVAVWAWCLMPNHVHLVLVPPDAGSLASALGEAHRRYTRHVNLRERWRGYLWQGRFASCAMDEAHLLAAVRYVELNPVRARLAGGLALVVGAGAPARRGGRAHGPVAAAGAGPGLGRLPRRRAGSTRRGGDPVRRAHGPPARLTGVRGGAGGPARAALGAR